MAGVGGSREEELGFRCIFKRERPRKVQDDLRIELSFTEMGEPVIVCQPQGFICSLALCDASGGVSVRHLERCQIGGRTCAS